MPGPDGYRLTPVGEELVEDGHSLGKHGLRGAHAALDLSLSGLHETLRTGRAGFRTWAAAESVALASGGAGSWRAAAPSCCAGCW
ncbi:hypothetical protein ACFQ7Z_17420 [Streptomyces virginiae]|uniref:hypothetical protein n=1 Tax=Streptomyces virginiae TaxID=1961 RepID=UPI00369F8A5A